MLVWKLKVEKEIKNKCKNGSGVQLGADKDLINKDLLGFNTGKRCVSIFYGLSEIRNSFVRSQHDSL